MALIFKSSKTNEWISAESEGEGLSTATAPCKSSGEVLVVSSAESTPTSSSKEHPEDIRRVGARIPLPLVSVIVHLPRVIKVFFFLI